MLAKNGMKKIVVVVLTFTLSLTVELRAEERPFLTSPTQLTLLSANDGVVMRIIEKNDEASFPDSVTVIHLGPDHPPIVKTVFETVPNTIAGPPHMAIVNGGRFGVVTNHSLGLGGTPYQLEPDAGPNVVSIIDLTADRPHATQIKLPPYPVMAVSSPDGQKVLVGGGNWFHILRIADDGKVAEHKRIKTPLFVAGFDVSPNGKTVLAAGTLKPKKEGSPFSDWDITLHVLDWAEDKVVYKGPVSKGQFDSPYDGAFAPRFGPHGKRAFALNGLGIAGRGKLDDLLVVDMTTPDPEITAVVEDLADGPECIAVHPSGNTVVVACPEPGSNPIKSHLAVIDVRDAPRLLCHLPATPIPEGMEFSPDGSQLFVGNTGAHHIEVYDVVNENRLVLKPYVLHTGHCHASLAISKRADSD